MEKEKNRDIDERQQTKDSTLFFTRTISKEQWDLLDNKNRIRSQCWNQCKKRFIQVWKTEIYCN